MIEKTSTRLPKWLRLLWMVLYLAPPLFYLLYPLVTLSYGVLDCMALYFPSLVLALFLFAPNFSLYYAALTLIHALVDAFRLPGTAPRRLRVILFSFIASALLAANALFVMYEFDHFESFASLFLLPFAFNLLLGIHLWRILTERNWV